MRSFQLVTLTPAQFDEFSAREPHGNFQQTAAMASLRTAEGTETELLGVAENGCTVAEALFETHHTRLSTFAEVHDGPLFDYHDAELRSFFLAQLKAHAKAKGAAQLSITPETPYRRRSSQGEPIAGELPDDETVAELEALGFKHEGFTVGYTAVPRWRYVKDLSGISDGKALLKSYSKRTQWSVKRAAAMGVHVRELGAGELGVFADIEKATADRRGFGFRGREYFERFKEAFGDAAHFLVAEIHIAEYAQQMRERVAGLERKVAALQAKHAERPTTKTERQLGEESRNLAAARKRLAEAQEFAADGDVLPAAVSLFVEHPNETIYLFSGSDERYKTFYPSALIQYEAMLRYCVERGVARYNFYGIDGVFGDPDSEGHGVLEFKQGFDGEVEELPGEFTAVVRPLTYRLKTLLHHLHS